MEASTQLEAGYQFYFLKTILKISFTLSFFYSPKLVGHKSVLTTADITERSSFNGSK